jgi:hypothetical protein
MAINPDTIEPRRRFVTLRMRMTMNSGEGALSWGLRGPLFWFATQAPRGCRRRTARSWHRRFPLQVLPLSKRRALPKRSTLFRERRVLLPMASWRYGRYWDRKGTFPRFRKAFFSEEKKQKTFISLSRVCPSARDSKSKSFLVLFFKKELLAFTFVRPSASRHSTRCYSTYRVKSSR